MSEPMVLRISNPHRYDTLFGVSAYWGSLPDGASLIVAFAGVSKGGGGKIDQDLARLFPPTIGVGCGSSVPIGQIHRLKPDGNRRSDLPEILVPARGSVYAAVLIEMPAKLSPGPPPQFDLVQAEAGRVAGGCTFQIRGVPQTG